ncbi:MAG: hypothetical protein QM582_08560 [Micropruina sp.]|uniref:hypothetical protein n=1 Tax=Micropruina sp. TaxID=2737536 RepID=UPI0039E3AF32
MSPLWMIVASLVAVAGLSLFFTLQQELRRRRIARRRLRRQAAERARAAQAHSEESPLLSRLGPQD